MAKVNLHDTKKSEKAKFTELQESVQALKKAEVFIKATGRAIKKAMDIGKWFDEKDEYSINVKTGTILVVDDIVEDEDLKNRELRKQAKVKQSEDQAQDCVMMDVDALAAKTDVATAPGGPKQEAKERNSRKQKRDETDELPESRTRWCTIMSPIGLGTCQDPSPIRPSSIVCPPSYGFGPTTNQLANTSLNKGGPKLLRINISPTLLFSAHQHTPHHTVPLASAQGASRAMAYVYPDGSSYRYEHHLGCGSEAFVYQRGTLALKVPKILNLTLLDDEKERRRAEYYNEDNREALERDKEVYKRMFWPARVCKIFLPRFHGFPAFAYIRVPRCWRHRIHEGQIYEGL
ncbi:predicted protein [Uncinocarpus reesii 1704]|uniref:Uncharacterized protein n=1 Tax=Uncinocarpus reesii (strain UAMH 1704) TaxID=336963 RepID=C4JW67_UNCRE|nr:uncharacterized protein UREG_06809 [Uncinocarpus reesii 1704]EEP81944.1 predicted protein [Uncinocarpus reesii 1704]